MTITARELSIPVETYELVFIDGALPGEAKTPPHLIAAG
jgi:hypothetical protein